ncbi:MAG: hypothetical protein ACKPKO_57390, partial [Candidatus Fonsibacter sp.]
GFRPNIKYGAGKLSWVSLTVNNHTFIKQEPTYDRLGYRRNDGGARHGRLQQTTGRQDRVPLLALPVRAQELLQRAGHRDPG